MKPIRVGDTFTTTASDGWVYTFRREADDPAPVFECERMQVTQLGCTGTARFKPFTFGAEPEWFRRRGLAPV